ncbi:MULTISPECIES: TetR/AcrR family transcriptional regulator [Dactylosporangium]|uniref:TetR family transcriptional regulator n=2 Tax=Dactylosporangium TaxID=35753 RepID=A0A9W6KGH9_9ACTN|nr:MULTISPECIES: TetR/AcrR family transcriptional regulator [Dactylosporangium]UAC01243.1 TetR family transcriptional regulator [Dactylosporangium vinaceum]UWZ48809.1 TetR family transcriptional regulator [Dactylosporangium matsuzakiense]GLL01088.1 TetR family transcriptional regulator [Dactylosporangium matsuzakiense]
MRTRAALTPELIIDAASRLAASAGADALTVRALGKELGADPTAIYRHFRDKDEIILEVADRLVAATIEALPADRPWRARLEWLARQTVRLFVAHPAIAPIVALRTTRRPGEFQTVEAILGALREAGLSDADAAMQHLVFSETIFSYAAMSSAYAALDEKSREGDEAAWSREYRTLPPQRYPNIAAATEFLAGIDDDMVLEGIVRALLDRVEALARSQDTADARDAAHGAGE